MDQFYEGEVDVLPVKEMMGGSSSCEGSGYSRKSGTTQEEEKRKGETLRSWIRFERGGAKGGEYV